MPAGGGADDRDPVVRLGALLDRGTLRLLVPDDGCGVVAATGACSGTPVVAFASDARVQGGALGAQGCRVVLSAYERALAGGSPVVGLWHSGGARLAEGAASLQGVGSVFAAMTAASGRVPQVSVVTGPAAGGAAYGPALTDVVVLGPQARVFLTGPDVVRSVTGEDTDAEGLGGPDPHARRSGLAGVVAGTAEEALARARDAVALLGAQGSWDPEAAEPEAPGRVRDPGAALPASARRAYDVHPVLDALLDDPAGAPGSLELHPRWAPNAVTVLGRLGGRTVGVLASNPLRLAGCLDSASAEKAARFVRMCDALGVPLLVLVDSPGYLPGVAQEHDGVVRRGAKLLHAFAEAVVPQVTVVLRKAYGGAQIAMGSKALGASAVLAWPGAEIAVMGATAAVRVLHRRELAGVPADARAGLEERLAAEHAERAGGLRRALEVGVVDEVVEPARTRARVAALLAAAPQRRGAHGNIPL